MNLPTFEIEIGGMKYTNSFPDDVRIDRTDLDEEFVTQAEKYAYWGFIAEKAKARYYVLKFELEQLYARVEFEKRQAAAAMRASDPKFKHTEKMCDSEVITDTRYSDKKLEVLQAQELAGLASKAADAIAQRRDMLIQMGANVRVSQAPSRVMDHQRDVGKNVIAENKAAQAAKAQANGKSKSRRKPKTAA